MFRMTPSRRHILAAALVLTVPAAALGDDPLASALQQKAPAVIEYARRKGFKNIGVLKFLVRRGDGAASDIGDLNLSLANKTEVALILANTDENFGILDKASDFVDREKITSANHLTVDGRKAFFTRKYDLAWSRDKVEPSGFVTGLVTLSDDLQKVTLQLQVFDRSGVIEDLPGPITASTDPEMIGQAGFSYTIAPARQKALIAGEPPPAADVRRHEAAASAAKSAEAVPEPREKQQAPFPPLTQSPVKWKVLYNGKEAAVTGNRVPEPGPNDRIEFVLSNPGPGTYAVVLLVNGENTLYQERNAPLGCRKWVLSPGTEVKVRGFQMNADTVSPFRVVHPEDVEKDVVRYGPHAGTYRMVVFHGTLSSEPPKDETGMTDMAESGILAIARTRGGTRPEGVKPQSLRALQAMLRGRAKSADGARGFVVKGKAEEKFETENVYFRPSSDTPVADVTLRYLAPRRKD